MDGTSSAEAAEAQQLYSLIKRHAWIMQCWLTNFCCNSYWERLPESWREALLSLSDEEMQELPAGLHPPTTWPPELRELVLTAQQLAPPTQAELDASVERVSPMLLDGIPHVRNMGPKKQHEVLRLAPVVAREAARCGASTVVDLGSGHGYLSHVLAFHHGLHVIGIECAAHNCAAAHHRAWMVREKLRDVKFRVSNPKAPTKAQLKMAELSAHVALGGGEKVRAEAAPRACKCSLWRLPPHRYAPRRPVRRRPMRRMQVLTTAPPLPTGTRRGGPCGGGQCGGECGARGGTRGGTPRRAQPAGGVRRRIVHQPGRAPRAGRERALACGNPPARSGPHWTNARTDRGGAWQ